MRARLVNDKRDQKGSFAISLAIHAFVIAAIASITFRYPIGAFLGLSPERHVTRETIQYVKPQPRPPGGVGNGAETKPKLTPSRVGPAPLIPPVAVPPALPPIPKPGASQGAVSGTPAGTGGAPAGIATGIEPRLPDPRLDIHIGRYSFPKSLAQQTDSAVRVAFEAYRAATIAAQESQGRNPKDWTFERNGQKYGLDSQRIYLGKFWLPSAILAALPMNSGGVDGQRVLDNRSADWIRQDILSHSQGMSEGDFKAAVKRIRERKERERQDEEKAKKAKPVVATGKNP
jgi:hypothetical protein